MTTDDEDRSEARSAAAQHRQAELLALVRRDGRLDVGPAAARLGVTQETLRRDLRAMERAGLVRRSYGAAFPVESGRFETRFDLRESSNPEEKNRIAAAAISQIGSAQTIYIDEGFLPLLVARGLPSDRPLTIVTGSLPAAMEIATRPELEVLLIGGRVRGTTFGTVEHGHDSLLSRLMIDIAFLGANGISASRGLTTPDPSVAAVKSAAIAASNRRIFVGAHTKFGVSSFVRFAGVADFEALITGEQLPAHRAQQFSQLGPRVLRV
ncbi:DeoR/GlpR family DNA-binding transcription regulator [Plantibacter sp. YIM 135249]|uniref:DeoR/GlpR family DNA-binding transcription regulator n=1 Tax=Plantibacter sp. YIM 135249 TaxID=3423918 RepID=UPI003D33063C